MLSSRRVKKGPGRRPLSAKRQRFVELRERGWSVLAAARGVGVSRTTGANWSRGYKTYRRGQVTGFVPPLERLAVRDISARFLSQDERIEIADLRRAGMSVRQVAARLGRAPSTISRELRRNAARGGDYRPFEAHRQATARRARSRQRRIEASGELRQLVSELLAQRWSPQQISRHLRLRFPGQPGMRLCHESIYQALYQPGSPLLRPTPLAPFRRSPLRTGRDHRRAPAHRAQAPAVRAAHAHDRPAALRARGPFPGRALGRRPDHRQGPGSAIGTLVERQTRLVRLLHLPARDGEALHEALKARLAGLPAALLRTITWDQGTEMARHLTITRSLGAPVYFCDSHSPWQRGSNENTNGLLRDYFPKGTDLSVHSPEHLLAVENELNSRPRRILNDQTPAELFAVLLASENPPVLRR